MRYAEVLPSGRVVAVGNSGPDAPVASPGRSLIDIGNLHVDPDQFVYRDGVFTPIPPQPSPAHTFSYVTDAWEVDAAVAWSYARAERNRRLAATDWVVLRAADTGQPVPPEWLAYRQALRDITEQPDPLNIEWPVAPSA